MRQLQTISERRLDHSVLPMRLYHKAKKLGVWDPRDIDFAVDRRDWVSLPADQQTSLLRMCSLFQAGEESVTLDLLPLIQVIAAEGRLEEEMFLTTFLFEEAKHTEVFRRFLDEVAVATGDLTVYQGEGYRKLFYEYLPQAMQRLAHDPSAHAQVEAAVTYNMVVEGVLAETGYFSFYRILEDIDKLPGLRRAIGLLKQDESRHIAYGTYLISRLVCEADELWEVVEQRLALLMPQVLGVINRLVEDRDLETLSGSADEFSAYASRQLQARIDVLRRARGKSIADLYALSEESLGVVDEA